jgi:uncharacterized membrane protein
MLLPIHVAAGGLALVLGAVALLVKKGGTAHRRSGLLFVSAMIRCHSPLARSDGLRAFGASRRSPLVRPSLAS